MAEPLLHFITIVNPFNVEWRILQVVGSSSTIVRDSTVDSRHAATEFVSISLWCFRRSALWLWAWIVCHSSWAQRPTTFNKQRTFMIMKIIMILSRILWWIFLSLSLSSALNPCPYVRETTGRRMISCLHPEAPILCGFWIHFFWTDSILRTLRTTSWSIPRPNMCHVGCSYISYTDPAICTRPRVMFQSCNLASVVKSEDGTPEPPFSQR